MERVLWINSNKKMAGLKANDGLGELNDYLEEGWVVKHISACTMGDSVYFGQAYVVIEKKDR